MVTVRQLRALGVLRDAVLVGGERGLDSTVTEVIATSSVDSDQIGPATLVVVDGSRLGTDSYLVDMALRAVHQRRGSALVVTARTTPFAVTAARLANKLDIPLLVMAADDTLAVADAMRQLVVAPAVEKAHLTHRIVAALRHAGSASLDAMLERVADVLDATVSLVGLEGQIIAGAPLDPPIDMREQLPVPTRSRVDRAVQLAHPVELAPREKPSIWVVVRRHDPLESWTDATADALAIIAWAASSRLVSARLRVEIDARSRLGILNSILAAVEPPDAALLEQMTVLGWRFTGWCTAVHVHASGETSQQRILAMTGSMGTALKEAGVEGPLIERPDGWTLWLESAARPPVTSHAEVEAAVLAAVQRVTSQHVGTRLHAGIGLPHHGFEGLRTSLGEAREASLIAQGNGGQAVVQHIDTLGVRRILYGWYASPSFEDFAETLLDPIRAVDGSGDLLHTLETYLDCESSPTSTATTMYLHRNTVLNRMERVRELLAVDLDDAEQRLAVQLACRMLRLRESRSPESIR